VKNICIALGLLGAYLGVQAELPGATLTVDATAERHYIYPAIYGKNHGLEYKSNVTTSAAVIQRHLDAGFKILRLNAGNNATKYHFRNKLTSHPDWYNNVYNADWDRQAKELQDKMPGVQGLYAISMLGWAAKSDASNFEDFLYNGSAWWTGVNNDWAGTTKITKAGQQPTDAANKELYLTSWPADSSVKILDHWFGSENGVQGLGLDKSRFVYWNMDNEADIWAFTHSDAMPDTLSAEGFVQIYVHAAKLARAKYPGIKLVGPVATNEWQWYTWKNKLVPTTYAGRDTTLPFVEFFLKRIAEEQAAANGTRLLDVVDYHFYPEYGATTDKADIAQLHRLWFDKEYSFPKANGIKAAYPGETKTYIFARTNAWLERYFGADHGITLGITECGAIDGAKDDASLIAVWYASQLGEFAKSGSVEVFTPWTIYNGMFETMHLFSAHAKDSSVASSSTLDSLVSAYASVNTNEDSLTVILVNRDLQNTRKATVNLAHFAHGGTWAPTFRIADLNGETFVSKSKNAAYANGVDVASNSFTLELPQASVTAVVLSAQNPGTKPEFSSSSSGNSSSSSSSYDAQVWTHVNGRQVNQPSGSAGGWWYGYADPLSTFSEVSADAIAAEQGLHMILTAKSSATQPYSYAGVGFGWGNTASGAALATVDLSAYSHICLDYQSTVPMQPQLGQPSKSNAAKQVMAIGAADAIPVSATQTVKCLELAKFPAPTGETLNLAKQSAFQLQISASGEYTLYGIYLVKKAATVLDPAAAQSTFTARVQGRNLLLELAQPASSVRLHDLAGRLVRQWTLEPSALQARLELGNLVAGRYWVAIPGRASATLLYMP
jgi:hypothetical protein